MSREIRQGEHELQARRQTRWDEFWLFLALLVPAAAGTWTCFGGHLPLLLLAVFALLPTLVVFGWAYFRDRADRRERDPMADAQSAGSVNSTPVFTYPASRRGRMTA